MPRRDESDEKLRVGTQTMIRNAFWINNGNRTERSSIWVMSMIIN